MWNRREMLSRIMRCQQAGVPITNYGLTIAYSLGIFERALESFPRGTGDFHVEEKESCVMKKDLTESEILELAARGGSCAAAGVVAAGE